jgi:hypothetical protein
VIKGLFAHLSGHLPTESEGLLRVSAIGLVKNGGVILAPSLIENWTDILAPRLYRSGVQYVDAPEVAIDPERVEVVVTEPALEVDLGEWDLGTTGPVGIEPAPIEAGRYPLVGWALFQSSDSPMWGGVSRAQATVAAAGSVISAPGIPRARVIDELGRLFGRVSVHALGSPYEGDLASKLVAGFSS